ncbi:Eco57I restriction-modification methylase domain-containing protein, partial [Clostridioides difficile]
MVDDSSLHLHLNFSLYLYFCFYKKIIDILKQGGIGSVITPRYFLESLSGKDLREYIKSNV